MVMRNRAAQAARFGLSDSTTSQGIWTPVERRKQVLQRDVHPTRSGCGLETNLGGHLRPPGEGGVDDCLTCLSVHSHSLSGPVPRILHQSRHSLSTGYPANIDPPGSYPLHGDVEWIPVEDGGRPRAPSGPVYAAVGWRDNVGSDMGTASFVLKGFDTALQRSSAEGRWLVPLTAAEFQVEPGDMIVVAEGSRPVARFYVRHVDDQHARWGRIESWLRSVLSEVALAPADRRQAEEYLDHNELGVAFQHIVAALAEHGEPVTLTVKSMLADAAADMDLHNDPDWRFVRDLQE
jgi:hypothetical protein